MGQTGQIPPEGSRHLSIAEYFDVLQREYILAEFRRKIYYSPKDKRYYGRVMGHKRKKIEDIATRNHLDSIFNSDDKLTEIRSQLFDLTGKPRFALDDKDRENYYTTGNEFSFRGGVWILDAVNKDGTLVMYSPHLERYETVSPDEVLRIL